MTHVRRNLVDVLKSEGSHIAKQAIEHIARLYTVEYKARRSPPERRVKLRQTEAKPVLDDLESWP